MLIRASTLQMVINCGRLRAARRGKLENDGEEKRSFRVKMRATAVPDRKVSGRVGSVPSPSRGARVRALKPLPARFLRLAFASAAPEPPNPELTPREMPQARESAGCCCPERSTWKRHFNGVDQTRRRSREHDPLLNIARPTRKHNTLTFFRHSSARPTVHGIARHCTAWHGTARHEVKPVTLALLPLPSRSQKLSEQATARVESHFRFRLRVRASRTLRARACAQSSRTECTVRYLLCVRSLARPLARSIG